MQAGTIGTTAFDPTAPHTGALWIIAIVAVGICLLIFLTALILTPKSWENDQGEIIRSISRERLEKSCDTVLSVCSLLVPASLGLLTWLADKVGPASYILPLLVALAFFFILLIYTVYLRFNYLWQLNPDFPVSSKRNLVILRWLTTATSAIVLGLALLTVPIVELGLGWLHFKPTPPPASTPVVCNCKITTPPPPQPPPCKPVKHLRHRSPCACKK
jgi:hypothetical protein